MDVCLLINQLAPGGAPTLLLDIVRRTDDAAEFTVCFVEGDDTLVADFRAAGARVVGFGAEFKFDPRALTRLGRFFRRESFDVVHAHLPYAQTLGRVAAALSAQGAVVSTQHNFPSHYHPITRTLERATRPVDDATVAVSQAVERAFTGERAHEWPERNGRWTTIYNGVDIEGFGERVRAADGAAVRERHDIDAAVPLALSVGRYVAAKNQRAIIEAFAAVRERAPDAHLLLLGWGPLREVLDATAYEHGVADAVTVAGRTASVAPYYAAADAFVSASHSESFGLTLVEALAAGLPTVGPDVPGAREVLDRGGGTAVPPDDVDELAAAMGGALDGDSSGGASARLDAFDIERTVDAHLSLYREVGGATRSE